MTDIFQKLAAPFPPEQVSWRVGSTNADKTKGLALAYLDARDVMERLDAVVGPANWQCRYPHANGKTVCEIGICIRPPHITVGDDGRSITHHAGEWVWKADGSGDTDVEAEKGALSDAFKRAAVRWGIGRYLYDLGNTWAEIEPMGRSFKIKESEYAKLRRRLPNTQNSAPASTTQGAEAGGEAAPRSSPPADGTPKSPRIIANTLIEALKGAKTEADLTAWAADNKTAIDGLPEAFRDEVRLAYAEHLQSLRPRRVA